MTEEWRDVPSYEGLYQVSNLGRVRGLDRVVPCSRWGSYTVKGRILAPVPKPNGYLAVNLRRSGEMYTVHIHALVAQCFIGERPDGYTTNHVDGDKTNNRADNLEYCTPQQNTYHASHTLGNGPAKLTNEQAIQAYVMYKTQDVTMKQVARRFGVTAASVHRLVHGETWAHLDLDSYLPAEQLALPLEAT